MKEEPNTYHAYLLRLWRVQSQDRWQWRASLESPQTGEHLLFASLEQCWAFLHEQCGEVQTREGCEIMNPSNSE